MLFFLIFPLRTRIALDRLERHPGLCSAVGLLGWGAVLPLGPLAVMRSALPGAGELLASTERPMPPAPT